MSQVTQATAEREEELEILNICNDLFREWLCDLTSEEQKIWLWNAKVQMVKIRKRRQS